MKAYEVLYIIDNAVTDEKREEIVNKVKALVENNGGKAEEPEKWGLRKFAYPIAYKNEGYYVLMNFEAPVSVPQILNSQLLIMEGIVRFMVSAK
ncbi:MAG: 30S ribosomal protein S6 [Clostridia bacterium]|nr:30S ribosomal protein S6 [Clostridia bacterium]